MATPILVTGAAGRVGAVGRTVTELLLKQGKAVRAMVRNEDDRAQALRNMGAEVVVGGITIPSGYRDWKLISVAREEGNLNDIRAQLGNDIAIKAYREGKLPLPDGTIIAAIHWEYAASEENNKVFGRVQSFVAGPPKNMQFMIKDSKKFAATGGWVFADFRDGKPASEAVHNTCFPCHAPAKDRDYVFTRYAP